MLRLYCLVLLFFTVSIHAACPSTSSIYLPSKVKCSSCQFHPPSKALQGSGNTLTINCPPDFDLWFYNDKGKEFVAPMSAVKSKGTLQCDGSKWKITIPGQSQTVSALACASS